jgi:hypothetical protein
MEDKVLSRARDFIYRHARLIDRRRYEYWFEGGSGEAVIQVLAAYQNEDGGFGHALEPDIRCPYSQPVPTEVALTTMMEVGHYDEGMFRRMIGYLRSITLPEGGLPFVHANVREYPHAPWWDPGRDNMPSLNPTGSIIGMLYRQTFDPSVTREEWFVKCVDYIWRTMEREEMPNGYHEYLQWMTFLTHTPERERAIPQLAKLDAWLRKPGSIELDVDAEGYVQKVLDIAPSPDSYARKFVSEEMLTLHLDALIARQQEDGGWPINWVTVSPVVEWEWRGYLAVERLKTLRAYGRL